MASKSNGDSCGSEAASGDGANNVPVECGREISGRVVREQQLRDPVRMLSTFMLDASAAKPFDRLWTDPRAVSRRLRRDSAEMRIIQICRRDRGEEHKRLAAPYCSPRGTCVSSLT
jgi:hypothetical protein